MGRRRPGGRSRSSRRTCFWSRNRPPGNVPAPGLGLNLAVVVVFLRGGLRLSQFLPLVGLKGDQTLFNLEPALADEGHKSPFLPLVDLARPVKLETRFLVRAW